MASDVYVFLTNHNYLSQSLVETGALKTGCAGKDEENLGGNDYIPAPI
jgi:hypothetical protein